MARRAAAKRPQPLLNRAVITAGAGLLVALGLVTADVADQLVVVLTAALPVLAAIWSRSQVTPLCDPRDAAGQALAPVDPLLEQVRRVIPDPPNTESEDSA